MKNKFLILLILLGLQSLSAQQDDYKFDASVLQDYKLLSNPSVQSPDVAAFQKVTQIPVSNYTGRANISIPIYNIQVGNMSVPLSITYNTSGVKVADMPSNVGSNWALNAGGVVTKSVQGLDDFTIPDPIPSQGGGFDEWTSAGWLFKLIGSSMSVNQQNDPMPDIYHVSAPGLSTKYIHEKVINDVANPVEIENNGNLIEETIGEVYSGSIDLPGNPPFSLPTYGPTSLKVTGLNGVQYSFATPEVALNVRNGLPPSNILKMADFKANAFKLDSMYDPETNQTIQFEYEEYSNRFHDKFYARPNIYSYSFSEVSNRLINIIFDKGSVEFIYGLDRLDNTGEKALTDVLVKNHLGVVIKHMKFEYSYFQSTINPSTPQSKRLRLDKVYQVNSNNEALVGEYVFTYKTNLDMPPRDSWAHDFLGYNNGSYVASNTTPIPKIYKHELAFNLNYSYDTTSDSNYRRVYTPFDIGSLPETDAINNQIGNFSLEADEEASKAYILTGIKYPTGGQSEIEYEGNTFYYKGATRIGGGLRIKTLKVIDEYGIEQVLDYEYTNGQISQLPSYTNLSNYGLKLYNVPQSNIELTDGSFVGYEHVAISNSYDKQSTRYSYYNNSHFPNTPSTKTVFGSQAPADMHEARIWRASARYSLYIDRDILRGKLQEKTIVDNNGLYVLKEEYLYKLKEFRTINYKFQNNIFDPLASANNCYTNEGIYLRNCGGYDEEINFPIERNLLVSVKTKVIEDLHAEGDNTQGIYADYVETEKRYVYDPIFPRLKFEEHGISCNYQGYENWDWYLDQGMPCDNPDMEYVRKTYTYPSNGSVLWSQHRLTTPEFISYKNKTTQLKSEDYHYSDFGNGIIGLEKVDYFVNNRFFNTTEPKPSSIVIRRDEKGNVLEVVSQDGIYSSFIYGYGARYPICELNNVSYTELTAAAATLNISLPNLINSNSDSLIKTQTNQLRSHLSNGQITSYTYAPLVGVTSIIDVRGIETSYEYDDFNRFEYARDLYQNIISKNEYNYKN